MSTVPAHTAAEFDIYQAASIQWWLQHLSDAYAENPLHMLTELFLVGLVFYLVFARQKPAHRSQKLSAREEQQLIDDWVPEPLGASMITKHPSYGSSNLMNNNHYNNKHRLNSNNNNNKNNKNRGNTTNSWLHNQIYIDSAMSGTVNAIDPSCNVKSDEKDNNNNNGQTYIQFASHNYLGFANFENIKLACVDTIKNYAVGSCGPRGFYGTMDIHLNLESKLSDFFSSNFNNNNNNNNGKKKKKNNREAIIYADNIGCCASVITAFAKRGDLLLIDEGCHFLVTQGAILSRANVIWYPHNDMKQLETYLQAVQEQDERLNRPLNRRYIITEGIFHNHGDICNLQKICALKDEYKYRLILDDSHALGVLATRGSPEYWGIDMTRIDIYLSSMDTALGSTGGFCVGDHETIYHQTLSGAGYVFSASAPPFQCTAVIEALKILESEDGELYVSQLQKNGELMRQSLEDTHGRWILVGDLISPLIHLRLTNNIILNNEAISPRNNNNNNDSSSDLSSVGENSDDNNINNNEGNVFHLFEKACLMARNENVIIFPSAYLPQEKGIPDKADPKPSLRIVVTREHSAKQIKRAASVIKDILSKLLNDGRIETRHNSK